MAALGCMDIIVTALRLGPCLVLITTSVYQTIGRWSNRDGTVHISHERHKQCLLTCSELPCELQNLTDITHGPFSSCRNALWVHFVSSCEESLIRNFRISVTKFCVFCNVEKSAKFKDCGTVHGPVSVLNESKLPIREAVALCFLYPQDTCSTKVLAGGCSFVCRTVTVFSADLPGYGHENKLVRLFLYCIGWA